MNSHPKSHIAVEVQTSQRHKTAISQKNRIKVRGYTYIIWGIGHWRRIGGFPPFGCACERCGRSERGIFWFFGRPQGINGSSTKKYIKVKGKSRIFLVTAIGMGSRPKICSFLSGSKIFWKITKFFEIIKHECALMEKRLPRYCFEKKSAACQLCGSVRSKNTRNDAPEARTFLEKILEIFFGYCCSNPNLESKIEGKK